MSEKKKTYRIKSTFSGDLYVESFDVIFDEAFDEILDAVEQIEEMQKAS